jgi:hypothetical protein
MRSRVIIMALALGAAALLPDLRTNVVAASGNLKVDITDDCDPNADWGVGGCLRSDGSVTRAEFGAFLVSPLSLPTAQGPTLIGHPSWRMDPGYSTVEAGDKVKLENSGGRNHTFTKVADFGGGTVPPLRSGLAIAPECPTAVILAPGEKAQVSALDLAMGDNRFMCCIHSWMRTVIKVVPGHDSGQGTK